MDGMTCSSDDSWSRLPLEGWLVAVLLLSGLAVSSCGPVDEEFDGCTERSCDFGVCDSSTGACTNKERCTVSNHCLPGFECSDEGACEPITACERDDDCETGRCKEGGCVNPESCTSNSDCLERTYCATGEGGEKGTCAPDPCNDKSCRRGVCKRGTDRCVSKESCSEETELLDCVSGEKCADGTCAGEESYCDEISCDRGVCSFEAGGCVDASECTSDAECLEGKFCNEMNTCQVDLCARNNIDCGARGECQPNSGQCENASSCESTKDCIDDHLCVQGTCRLESNACGDAGGDGGCPGNQSCEYDEKNLEATCQEPETCETSVDCTGDRRCGGRTCIDPEMCRDDEFEANDAPGDATIVADVAPRGTVSAAACSGNSDFYEIDTTNYFQVSSGGTLVVDLDVPKRERGLGKLEVEVIDPDGNSLGTVDTGAMGTKSRARFTQALMATDHGTYTVKVSPAGSVKQTGVHYELSVDVLPPDAIAACQNADTITVNQRVSGTTENSASSAYGSSCTAAGNSSNEKIYSLTLDRPQELTFNLTPKLSKSDLTMSLRRRCSQSGTEIACSDAGGPGKGETFTELLGPGTYSLIVQSAEGEPGGPFQLKIENVFTVCATSQNYCDSKGTAHTCTRNGGQFTTVECENGCNPTVGECNPATGNRCGTAETIDPMNAQTRSLVLNQTTNEYEMPTGSCLRGGNTKTGGPEQTFKVSVPARKYVKFEAEFADEVDGSMYLVEDCSDVEGTCIDGVKESTSDVDREVLEYANGSMNNDETLFLVVDTDSGQEVSTAKLNITYKNLTCTPKDFQCAGGDSLAVCSEYGLQVETVGQCAGSCSGGSCSQVQLNGTASSDTCSDARNVTQLVRQSSDAVTFSGSWDDFTNDYEQDDACGGSAGISSFEVDGTESVYRLDLQAGEVFRAELSGDGDFVMSLQPEHHCGNEGKTCVTADNPPEGFSSVVEYAPQGDETVYLVADRDGDSGGSFEIDMEITQPCSPTGTAQSCSGSDLNYCTSAGYPATYSCGSSCSNAACDGDDCGNAVNLTSAVRQSGGTSFTGDWHGFTNAYEGDDTCGGGPGIRLSDTDGSDHFYEFDMKSDEVLSAEMSGDGEFSLYAKKPGDCGSAGTSCLAADEQEGDPASIGYYPGQAETVVLGADREEAPRGSFTMDVELLTSQCDPATYTSSCDGSGGLTYCTDLRQVDSRTCISGCSSGACDGETCSDAVTLTKSGTPVSHSLEIQAYQNDYDIDPMGDCGEVESSDDSPGPDVVFEISASAGDVIDATWKHDDGTIYLVENCSDFANTCVAAQEYLSSNNGNITYTAPTSQTYHLIVDVDESSTTDYSSAGSLDIDVR